MARKYPDRSVEVSIPKSPDLAIVEGAAYFVSVPPASGPGGQLPAPPRFAAVTSANSYGIVVSEVGREGGTRGRFLRQIDEHTNRVSFGKVVVFCR